MFLDAEIGNILFCLYPNFILVIHHKGEIGTDYQYSFKLSVILRVMKSRYMLILFYNDTLHLDFVKLLKRKFYRI